MCIECGEMNLDAVRLVRQLQSHAIVMPIEDDDMFHLPRTNDDEDDDDDDAAGIRSNLSVRSPHTHSTRTHTFEISINQRACF